jgi:hypothetical protein
MNPFQETSVLFNPVKFSTNSACRSTVVGPILLSCTGVAMIPKQETLIGKLGKLITPKLEK